MQRCARDGMKLDLDSLSVENLVDHRGRMAFIDELVEVDADRARCRGTIRADNPFLVNNLLPGWILVEYMAQSVAIFAGYTRAARGGEHQHGLLLSCRNLTLVDVALEVGSQLEIEVVEITRFERLGSFNARVTRHGTEAANGTLSVYEASEWPVPGKEPGTGAIAQET